MRAVDGGKRPRESSQAAQVVIRVERNDRAPTFHNEPYSQSIRRTAPAGTAILRVNATDADNVVSRANLTSNTCHMIVFVGGFLWVSVCMCVNACVCM